MSHVTLLDLNNNFQVKQEIDTTGFSFEAMLTMNTAKVKKSKKIKSSTVNEHDESVLEFEVGPFVQLRNSYYVTIIIT